LSRDDDIELIDAVCWSCELARFLVVCATDVGHDAVKDDVRIVGDWTDVVSQTDEERRTLTSTRTTYGNVNQSVCQSSFIHTTEAASFV